MIDIKTPEVIAIMIEGGQKLARVLNRLLDDAQVGVSLLDIEAKAQKYIKEEGATPSFTTVPGYKWATCLCVDDAIVHGIPNKYILQDGDVLTIDVGLVYQGYHTDTAWTKIVSDHPIASNSPAAQFLQVGQDALWAAIAQAKLGNRIGNISEVMQQSIESAGYSIVKTLVGHGVGKELHEDPLVPNFLKGKVQHTLPLRVGMTIAIEAIYAQGSGQVAYDDDGWTIVTSDGSLSAVFEHSIVITENEPVVLTKVKK